VTTKDVYDWSSYKFENMDSFTRYTGEDYNSLLMEDDAARQNWGSTWRIPTSAEWSALSDGDKFSLSNAGNDMWVTSRVPGYEGNRILLPSSGYKVTSSTSTMVFQSGVFGSGFYWTSTLFNSNVNQAEVYISKPLGWEPGLSKGEKHRYFGLTVRPVSN